MSINLAIFASGSGSNAENIIQYFSGKLSAKVAILLSNKNDAYALERAKRHNIPSYIFTREEMTETNKVCDLLKQNNIHFIILAGFLLRIPDNILNAYPGKIVNIHPSLLPKYGGKGMYGSRVHEAVVEAGDKETGITIHYIDENYDEGSVIFQASCRVAPTDSPEDVATKVHALEYKYYPRVIEDILLKLGEK